MSRVITYTSSHGDIIHITPAQERILTAAGVWPRDSRGEEMCSVRMGLHAGEPSLTDDELRERCGIN